MNKTLRAGLMGLLVIAVLASAGCATSRVVPAPDFTAALPAVAAQYRTQVRDHHGVAQGSQWRFWRSADSIVRENLADRTGEQWQHDGATVFHQKLYHQDRRGIEFQPADLQMAGALPNWARESLIVDPALLARLGVIKTGWRDGHPVRRYGGTVDGARWDITLRVDLMLPVRVERRMGGRTERVDLLNAYALDQAPWQPTSTDGYDILDYADLGDHERDPFVMRVQSQLGGGHAH